MYPVLKEGVSVGTFQYEDSDTIHYYAENADGEEFEINHRLWRALLHADGTEPLDLPDKGQKILPALKKRGLIQISRFVRGSGIFNEFILFPIGRRLEKGSLFCKAVNAALPMAAVLLFAIGVYRKVSGSIQIGYYFNQWLYMGLILFSLMLHEMGHLVAGLAYGYNISDTGILLLGICPIGAYVAHEDKEDARTTEKLQFALSGIEMNLLLAGICLLAAMWCYPLSRTLVSVASGNLILAGVNLLPAAGLDGEAALSALCGVESISEVAKKWLLDPKRRRKLFRSGFPGYACLGIFALTFLSKILFWLLIVWDILSVLFD